MTDASAEYDLEKEVVRISMADKLRDVVGELPANERQAIELRVFQGLHLPGNCSASRRT